MSLPIALMCPCEASKSQSEAHREDTITLARCYTLNAITAAGSFGKDHKYLHKCLTGGERELERNTTKEKEPEDESEDEREKERENQRVSEPDLG